MFDLVTSGIITQEEALTNSMNPNDLKIKFQTSNFVASQEEVVKDGNKAPDQQGSVSTLGKMPKPF